MGRDWIWEPPADALSATNVGRFMAEHGVASIDELRARSVAEPEWFWDAVVRFLDIPFATPYEPGARHQQGHPVGDVVQGRHAQLRRRVPAPSARPRWRSSGRARTARSVRWTYGELNARRQRARPPARAITSVGVGDRVGIFCRWSPRPWPRCSRIAKIGAVFLPLFSGYGADAIATRMGDAGAKALITADGFWRRGNSVPMLATAEQAVARGGAVPDGRRDPAPRASGRAGHGPGAGRIPTPSRSTSVQVRQRAPAVRRLHVGHHRPAQGLGARARRLDREGGRGGRVPDRLPARRHAVLVHRHGLDHGSVGGHRRAGQRRHARALRGRARLPRPRSPVGVPRAPRGHDPRHQPDADPRRSCRTATSRSAAHDLSRLRMLGSTGEPWNDDPYRWYAERRRAAGRCPVINLSGGTEVGACFLSPHPVEPLKPMSLGGPALGMAVDVFDDDGQPVRGQVGELVCTQPWPGMTRGLLDDPERYLETYWSRWPDVWVHGDWASVDEDGEWFLHGRSDDTIKVAGKRLGPAEVETILVSHDAVVEAAAIGVPDEVKGEELWCYVVLAPGHDGRATARASSWPSSWSPHLGKSFRPAQVRFTSALPKTRNAKIVRRAIRAVVTGRDPGDLSSLEDPATIEAVRQAT